MQASGGNGDNRGEPGHLAGERDIRNAAGVTFIIPVVVDDTPVDQLKRVPDRFMAKHVLPAPGGTVTDELVAAVRAALDPPS